MKLRGLYAITPEEPGMLDKLRQALDGGIALLQYRRKRRDLHEAREVAALARRHGVPLIVNDDIELALELDAHGVHLGREDGDLGAARRRLRGRILGASCYNDAELARRAIEAGADYVAFGSVFASPTKPAAVRAPLALFAIGFEVPLCAIGGITVDNAPQVLDAGADLVAVVSDLFDAPDITARAAQYRRLFA
jgi:thiamine-phosphate pyrophosphorylase